MTRVLVVDDDERLRRALDVTLAAFGFERVLAASGAEAIRALERSSFHLVLTDLQMPEMDGIALAAVVQSRWPHLPVLLMSGNLDEMVQRQAGEAGVVGCLRKPFEANVLLELVVRKARASTGSSP